MFHSRPVSGGSFFVCGAGFCPVVWGGVSAASGVYAPSASRSCARQVALRLLLLLSEDLFSSHFGMCFRLLSAWMTPSGFRSYASDRFSTVFDRGIPSLHADYLVVAAGAYSSGTARQDCLRAFGIALPVLRRSFAIPLRRFSVLYFCVHAEFRCSR